MSDNFLITENAASKILELSLNKFGQKLRFRIRVDGGGCSGFKYDYSFGNEVGKSDLLFVASNGTEVVIDDLSVTFLQGATLDYIEDLGSEGFEIKNPQAKARCGCGNSFSI